MLHNNVVITNLCRRQQQNAGRASCKLADINIYLELFDIFSSKPQYQISGKPVLLEPRRYTVMTKLIGVLRASMRTLLKWKNSKLCFRFICCLTIHFLNYGLRRGLRVFWNDTLTVSNFTHLNSLGSDAKHRRTIVRIVVFMPRIVSSLLQQWGENIFSIIYRVFSNFSCLLVFLWRRSFGVYFKAYKKSAYS
jgi:hypothetical protein